MFCCRSGTVAGHHVRVLLFAVGLVAAAYFGATKQPEIDTLDLSGVERADSACVSLLLNALREKSSLKIHALPESVRVLAELYEIEEWVTS